MTNQIKERRFLSNGQLTREQALWLCRAIWTHYRSDRNASDAQRDQFDIFNRTSNRSQFQRGRNWVLHPVGYDLKEAWYGSEQSGFREAWAALVSLSISQKEVAPEQNRTYTAYGLVQDNSLSIAVYQVTEVRAKSNDEAYLDYVKQCFSQLLDDVKEVPLYSPRSNSN